MNLSNKVHKIEWTLKMINCRLHDPWFIDLFSKGEIWFTFEISKLWLENTYFCIVVSHHFFQSKSFPVLWANRTFTGTFDLGKHLSGLTRLITFMDIWTTFEYIFIFMRSFHFSHLLSYNFRPITLVRLVVSLFSSSIHSNALMPIFLLSPQQNDPRNSFSF